MREESDLFCFPSTVSLSLSLCLVSKPFFYKKALCCPLSFSLSLHRTLKREKENSVSPFSWKIDLPWEFSFLSIPTIVHFSNLSPSLCVYVCKITNLSIPLWGSLSHSMSLCLSLHVPVISKNPKKPMWQKGETTEKTLEDDRKKRYWKKKRNAEYRRGRSGKGLERKSCLK